MASSKPSPIRPTGMGPVKNTSFLGGLIPARLTPVKSSGGPKSPRPTPMPNWGGSFKQSLRSLPTVRGGTGGQKYTKAGRQRLTPRKG